MINNIFIFVLTYMAVSTRGILCARRNMLFYFNLIIWEQL